MTTCILTILKAGENEKYNFVSETFNLHDPKCPNFRKILPHVINLKILHSLKNELVLLYHSFWNTLYIHTDIFSKQVKDYVVPSTWVQVYSLNYRLHS